jgi:hypothetical protein
VGNKVKQEAWDGSEVVIVDFEAKKIQTGLASTADRIDSDIERK